MRSLEYFLRPTQDKLFSILEQMYEDKEAIVADGKYILVPGEAPIMLVAHLDTVHKEPVRDICESDDGNIIMSPQGIGGDDRCGVYALHTIYKQSPIKPWLLFACDEETGCRGSMAFCSDYRAGIILPELGDLKLIIEIDRKGKDDAVFYDCDNRNFEKYIISKGFVTDWGSFSDISYIAPELGVAAVNLSSGYYNPHTQHEYINRKHLNATIQKVVEIVSEAAEADFPQYEYIKRKFYKSYSSYGWYSGGKYNYYDEDWYAWEDVDSEQDHAQLPEDKDYFDDGLDIESIPDSIRDEYLALLAYYTPAELEYVRDQVGDYGILLMYESEIEGIQENTEDVDDVVPTMSQIA